MSASNSTSVEPNTAATTSSAPEVTSTSSSLTSPTDTTSTTAAPEPSTTEEASTTTPTTAPPATTSEPSSTTEPTTEPSTSTSTTDPPTTTSATTQTTPTAPTTTSTTTNEPTPTTETTSSSPAPTTAPTSSHSSSVITSTQISTGENGSTQFITITSTVASADSPTDTPSTTSAGAGIIQSGDAPASGSLDQSSKIAVSVVVPIAAVALLVVAGIFFWRKRKQRKDAEEERRKEVEDYSYNPNNDPTLPDVNSVGGAYEMKEDGSSGYRGWGSTTLGGSTGRKASTTMSGGAPGVAYSDATSPTRGNFSDTRSGEALMGDGTRSPEGEILGAMGPAATDNRGGNVHRGPSNASSSYSAAGRSDGSAENGVAYGGPPYYDQYGNSNPYVEGANGAQRPGEAGGQPVIRDNPARRNTRIENPSHYPQQSAGISQNF